MIALGLLWQAGPVLGATPRGGGHYSGFHGTGSKGLAFTVPEAELRVSRSGSRLRGAGSYVEYGVTCPRNREDEGRVSLPSARIRRDGTFRAVKRRGRLRYRLRGRFVSRDEARVVLRVAVRARCRSGRQLVTLYRNGQPPFTSCRSQRARELRRAGSGRLFEQMKLHRGDGFYPYVFGCLFETNKRVELGRNWDDEEIEAPAIAGPFAGYALSFGSISGRQASIAVTDLRNGRVRRLGSPSSAAPGTGPNLVPDLVVKDNGTIAWIVQQYKYFDRSYRLQEVWAEDSAGRRLLDSGSDIKVDSLTLAGSTLGWVRGGARRTATLD